MFWLSKKFCGEEHIKTNHAAFAREGGMAALEYYTGEQGVGHGLISCPGVWRQTADAFLDKLREPDRED
jgi:hypothetical protein